MRTNQHKSHYGYLNGDVKAYNKKLEQQIQKHFKDKIISEELKAFLSDVNKTYNQYQEDQKALQSSIHHNVEKIDRINEKVQHISNDLLQANEELDLFVYSASHDLRGPLKSLLGLLHLSIIENKDDGLDIYLEKMKASVTTLDLFINEIISYSRNSRLDILADTIDFEEIVSQNIDKLNFLETINQIHFEINVEGGQTFYSDQWRLGTVFNNLISNAVKYHNLDQPNPFINILVQVNEDCAKIDVKDNGIGISSHHLQKIFKMFYRAHLKSNGSGLGLYIVSETVKKCGGTIDVSSEVGKGTHFKIILPNLKEIE